MRWSPSSESAVSFGPGFGDPRYRNLIEIYSAHGQSETYDPSHALSYESLFSRKGRSSVPGPHYAQDAWAAGEILGTIASSDDHSSRPGLSYRGLSAVLANELTRDAIFNALKERRTYGTTGQRILLSFKIENQMMGSRVRIPKGEFPHVEVAVYGTDDLEYLEVLKWDNEKGRWRDGHPVFETIRWLEGSGMHLAEAFTDSTYAGDSMYYVRAKQKNDIHDVDRKLDRQVWAWSSPIWVSDSLLLAGDNPGKVDHLRLRRSFPNPAKGMVSIRFYLPVDGEVSLELFDVLGHKVTSFFNEHQLSGWHTTHISTATLANGVYFLRLKSGNQVTSKKLLLLK